MANFVVLQSGGPTSVINRSLTGIVSAAKEFFPKDRVYGAKHGIEGLIADNLIDLTGLTQSQIEVIENSPGAFLGSTRHKINTIELSKIESTLVKNQIRVVHIIGGNDSAETGLEIQKYSSEIKMDIQVINVPKTIDNDLMMTDHCPGFASTAKFISTATWGIGKDTKSMGKYSPVAILEVMGRDTGWLASASGKLKNTQKDPPHFIGIPEEDINEENFISLIDNALNNYGFAVAVVAENCVTDKQLLSNKRVPYLTDDFGHKYHESIGQYLANKISTELKIRCRHEKPGTIQRTMMGLVSKTDYLEAHLVGQSAVEAAMSGKSNIMITLNPLNEPSQSPSTGIASLEEVAFRTRKLPEEFRPSKDGNIPDSYKNYLIPLIGQETENIFTVS